MNLSIATLISSLLLLIFQQSTFADEVPSTKPHGKDHSSSLHSHPDADPVELPPAYTSAVQNSEDATDKDVSRSLTPIHPGNDKLIWRKNDKGQAQLLVATWTSHASFYPKPGETFEEDYEVWVTAAPELKDFCKEFEKDKADSGSLSRRLEQLLGLPPNSGHKYVIELWVNPGDLFRPSADPDVRDREAQLDFPDVRGYVSVSEPYKKWYKETATARYEPKNGPAYPWTRLGYTYDWGGESRYGLSEFVILKGSQLTVHSVSTTDDYADSK